METIFTISEKCDQVGMGTLPRATFRRSPLRSSMMSSSSEVNNNFDNDTLRPKPVSKWHVDTNYGLKSASRCTKSTCKLNFKNPFFSANVPIEKEERASSVMRDRSSSWLDLTRPAPIERARTQSPIPLCERLELDDMDFDQVRFCDIKSKKMKNMYLRTEYSNYFFMFHKDLSKLNISPNVAQPERIIEI